MLFPREPERLAGPLCDGICWVSIGAKSRMILRDWSTVAGLYDVTGRLSVRETVVNLQQIMDAPSDDDFRTVVESARDDDLIERRRWNPVVHCESSVTVSRLGERRDVPVLGLLSVMGFAFRSRTAFPPAGVSLEHDAALSVSSQAAPPSARVLNVDGFSWVIGEPVFDTLGRAVFVTEDKAFLGDMGV